jgi:hypothetical protein
MEEIFGSSVEIIGRWLDVSVSVEELKIKWDGVREVNKIGILTSEFGKRYMCLFNLGDVGIEIARIEFAHFPNQVGYINWVWVNDKFWREGIASHIRVIDYLEKKSNSIYSKIVSDVMQKIARQQGFT